MPSHSELVTAVGATSPLLYYPMNTAGTGSIASVTWINSGSLTGSATDLTSTVHSGSISASGTLIPGESTAYLTVNGSSAVMLATSTIGTAIGAPLPDITVQIIVKPASGSGTPDATSGWIISGLGVNGETSATNYQFLYSLFSDFRQRMFFEYGALADDQLFVSDTGLGENNGISSPIGRTLHIIFTRDSAKNQVTWYINGLFAAIYTYTQQPTGGSSSRFMVAGAPGATLNSLAGVYGHAAVWNRVLTEAEIASLFAASGIYVVAPTTGALGWPALTSAASLTNLINLQQPLANKEIGTALDGLIDTNYLNPSNGYYWQ